MKLEAACIELLLACASACTNLLIPGGSSADGSTILAANADGTMQVGAVHHWPAQKHAPGELRPTWDWDFGKYLGAIPQPPETYNVVGNTNEHQLTIVESTFGGLNILDGTGGKAVCHEKYGCLDYGQLEWVTLARAKTAREAISVMDELMQTYGYASTGESFSIADPQEVWLMEVIGKGNISKGSVWVATRIPDGSVCAHANQARTREFPTEDAANFRHAPDVVTFARELGLFHGDDHAFSFSDVYDPVTFYGARYCEARVWSFFFHVASPEEHIDTYLDYAQGRNLQHRMPLYVRVKERISVNDTFQHMRNHFEGTWFDSSSDIGAGNWRAPNRLGLDGRPWSFGGKTYTTERPISISFTHWTQVAVQRPHHPYGVTWFGVDDSAFAVRAPFYGVTSRVPSSWDDGNCTQRDPCREALGLPGTISKFSLQSMFWVQNMVSNYAYTRYDHIAPAIYERLAKDQDRLQAALAAQDQVLLEMSRDGREAAMAEAATAFSFREAERLHREWLDFYGELFVTFVDGMRMERVENIEAGFDTLSGFKKSVYDMREMLKAVIAMTTGDRYEVPSVQWTPTWAGASLAAVPKDKRCLKSLGGSPDSCQGAQLEVQGRQVASVTVIAFAAVVAIICGSCVGLKLRSRRTSGGSESYAALAA